MKIHREIIICLICGMAILLTGCSTNTYNAKVANYQIPEPIGSDETSVFVFREKSSFGSARKFAIICNDTVMGVLTSGTFCRFNVKSGENEIVAYMSGPIMHYRLQDNPGKTVYLFCRMGYASGMFIEKIDAEKAAELMKQFKYMEIGIKNRKTKINYRDYYNKMYN